MKILSIQSNFAYGYVGNSVPSPPPARARGLAGADGPLLQPHRGTAVRGPLLAPADVAGHGHRGPGSSAAPTRSCPATRATGPWAVVILDDKVKAANLGRGAAAATWSWVMPPTSSGPHVRSTCATSSSGRADIISAPNQFELAFLAGRAPPTSWRSCWRCTRCARRGRGTSWSPTVAFHGDVPWGGVAGRWWPSRTGVAATTAAAADQPERRRRRHRGAVPRASVDDGLAPHRLGHHRLRLRRTTEDFCGGHPGDPADRGPGRDRRATARRLRWQCDVLGAVVTRHRRGRVSHRVTESIGLRSFWYHECPGDTDANLHRTRTTPLLSASRASRWSAAPVAAAGPAPAVAARRGPGAHERPVRVHADAPTSRRPRPVPLPPDPRCDVPDPRRHGPAHPRTSQGPIGPSERPRACRQLPAPGPAPVLRPHTRHAAHRLPDAEMLQGPVRQGPGPGYRYRDELPTDLPPAPTDPTGSVGLAAPGMAMANAGPDSTAASSSCRSDSALRPDTRSSARSTRPGWPPGRRDRRHAGGSAARSTALRPCR